MILGTILRHLDVQMEKAIDAKTIILKTVGLLGDRGHSYSLEELFNRLLTSFAA